MLLDVWSTSHAAYCYGSCFHFQKLEVEIKHLAADITESETKEMLRFHLQILMVFYHVPCSYCHLSKWMKAAYG